MFNPGTPYSLALSSWSVATVEPEPTTTHPSPPIFEGSQGLGTVASAVSARLRPLLVMQKDHLNRQRCTPHVDCASRQQRLPSQYGPRLLLALVKINEKGKYKSFSD